MVTSREADELLPVYFLSSVETLESQPTWLQNLLQYLMPQAPYHLRGEVDTRSSALRTHGAVFPFCLYRALRL